MSEKEYIVSLNRGVNYAAFNQEMIASTGAGDIPGRSVDIADARVSIYDALRNPVATNNTAKDIYKDSLHFGIF